MQRRSDERAQALLDALLEGRPSPGLARRAAAGLGLPERGRYAVAVLGTGHGGPTRHGPVRWARDADGVRWCWRTRADCEIAVVALGDGSLAEPAALLTERDAGPGGISPVVDGLAELGLARRLAGFALLTCAPRTREIVRLDERLPSALVVSRPELAATLVTEVFGPLLALAPAERALLVGTLEKWLECDGSVGRTAERLRCHRNTVFNRLRRLERLTSRSLSTPRELIEVMLALDAFRLPPPPAWPAKHVWPAGRAAYADGGPGACDRAPEPP
ncbi:helix-turn-helix domain-containing protein [Streptomyces sp. NBC_01433]|uniref:PucR family transcriptional regulator n=1 Tax=Streptomyces sp. NBC_01433 TaxID=2903864 RepID=UPI002251F1A2|nr:helix-turn-helix domain-containing protein [Streptomyces sp. NBC_01433]MCX4680254.1 helix-turn-helix domain-containing protein [Streptomyces sp. NBC_01433]